MLIWRTYNKKRRRDDDTLKLTLMRKETPIITINIIKTVRVLHSDYFINIFEIDKVYTSFDMCDITHTIYVNEKDDLHYFCIPNIVNKRCDYFIVFYWINELLYLYNPIQKIKQLQQLFKSVKWCSVFKRYICDKLMNMYPIEIKSESLLLDTCLFGTHAKQTKSLIRISKNGSIVLCEFNSDDENYILYIVRKLQYKFIQKYSLHRF